MNYGCKGPKFDVRDFRINSKKAGVINYPDSFCLDNPRVKNQQQTNSCVAHASSSILEYYTKQNLSTAFIYGMERKVCGEEDAGMYLVDACKIIKLYGDMLEKDCPGNPEVPKASDYAEAEFQDSEKLERASKYKIDSYYTCATNNDIKYALMNYGPVLGCIMWYDKYNFVDRNGLIKFNTKSEGGYHAIMIYGWNEKGWLIQNSWGEQFGKKGCFILPYQYPIEEAKVLVMENQKKASESALVKKSTSKFFKIFNIFLNE